MFSRRSKDKPLNFFGKSSIIYFWQALKYDPDVSFSSMLNSRIYLVLEGDTRIIIRLNHESVFGCLKCITNRPLNRMCLTNPHPFIHWCAWLFFWAINLYFLLKSTLKVGLKATKYLLNARKFLFIKSRCPEVFCKKGVLRNFANFTGNYLCQSLFLIKKETLAQRSFPVNYAKFLRTPFCIDRTSGCFSLIQIFII